MIWSSHIFFQHNGQWENTELFLDISFTLLWASKLCKLNSKSRIGTQVHAIVEKKNESFYNIKWVLESFVGHAFQSPKDEDILRVSFLSWPMKMATHTLFSWSFGQLKYRNRTQGQVHKLCFLHGEESRTPTLYPAHQWASHSFIAWAWQENQERFKREACPYLALSLTTARDAASSEKEHFWHISSTALTLWCFRFLCFTSDLKGHLQEFKNLFFNQLISEFLILWSLYMAANPCCHEDFLAMWQIQVSVINTLPDWCCQPDDHRRWQIPSAQGRGNEHLSH